MPHGKSEVAFNKLVEISHVPGCLPVVGCFRSLPLSLRYNSTSSHDQGFTGRKVSNQSIRREFLSLRMHQVAPNRLLQPSMAQMVDGRWHRTELLLGVGGAESRAAAARGGQQRVGRSNCWRRWSGAHRPALLEEEVSYAAAGAAARRSGHGGRIRRDASAWI